MSHLLIVRPYNNKYQQYTFSYTHEKHTHTNFYFKIILNFHYHELSFHELKK